MNFLVFIIFSLLLQGCAQDDLETEKKIIEYDPSFRGVLDKRDSLRDELNSRKTDFLETKNEINASMTVLKDRLKNAEQEYSRGVEDTAKKIRPDQTGLRGTLAELEGLYRRKKDEIADIEKDISEVNSLIEKKDALALTQEEIKTWNSRLASLIKKKEDLAANARRLEKDIEITRMKIRVIKI